MWGWWRDPASQTRTELLCCAIAIVGPVVRLRHGTNHNTHSLLHKVIFRRLCNTKCGVWKLARHIIPWRLKAMSCEMLSTVALAKGNGYGVVWCGWAEDSIFHQGKLSQLPQSPYELCALGLEMKAGRPFALRFISSDIDLTSRPAKILKMWLHLK